jgi:integrase
MARKRTTRNKKGEGNHWYDAKNKRHIWTIEHNGKPYKAADRDAERAKAKFEALKRQVLGDLDIEGGKQLLRDYLPHYIEAEVASHNKRSTAHDYGKRADYYILPTLGDCRLCDLRRRLIQAWVNAMVNDTTWALNSIRQADRLLKRCLDAAVADGLIEDNPAASVKVPNRRKGDELKIDDGAQQQAKAFTPEQMRQSLDEVKRTDSFHGSYVLYVLISELGPRRGEALGLRRKDVDFDDRVIAINQQVIRLDNEVLITTPKTPSSRREIPITNELAALLREQCLRVGAVRPDDLLFPGKDDQRRQPSSLSQHFRRVCQRLGFKGFTLHSLRKYAITDMRRHGADLEVTAAVAGHKGIRVTAETYSDAQMDRKRAAVEKGRKAE